MAIQEVRWTGDGIIEKKNHTVIYSCDKKKHIFGTGFILSKRIRPLLIDYVTKSSRLCKIRIKGAFFNYSFITFHAPTEDKDSVEKELFYEELHALYASCPKNDVKVLPGDANAKIGKEKEFRSIIGKFSLHDISSDNGKRLIDFAADHNMIIPSTMFQHKRIHKMTWRSPDGITYNQIDHFLIDSRHKSDIEDVRTYRGANLDSDRFLIIAKLRARISNIRKIRGKCLEKFDRKQLKDEAIKLKFRNQIDSNLEESKDNHGEEDA
ncbi:craniofacial development protein 2-like [Parasteatoda tepidariorum]|uniref:craniofacial development protein 2-like n=1 Tax=Parasteatoda tepidariorum TaxID=114398 RepID=UPI001C721D0F|nr:craniofacial development protein 2-like [Parasteatoda tepidariorum]